MAVTETAPYFRYQGEDYSAINGEEFARKVLDEVRAYLSTDSRFKRSVCYHRLKSSIDVKWSAYGQPQDEVTIGTETRARTLAEENLHLKDNLEAAEKKARDQVAKLAAEYTQRSDAMEQELLTEKAINQKLREELRGKAVNVRTEPEPEPQDPKSAEEWSISINPPVIEEPGRVRAELAASEEKIMGRSSAEMRSVDTSGQPAPPPAPANRGAIVGGGQRPANVLGRPR